MLRVLAALAAVSLATHASMSAQTMVISRGGSRTVRDALPDLSPRDRSLVTRSVLIATGMTAQRAGHLTRGLDKGITPGEASGSRPSPSFSP